jgi:S-methylmethionine-dependent homocysteine/selenocysteine methylase
VFGYILFFLSFTAPLMHWIFMTVFEVLEKLGSRMLEVNQPTSKSALAPPTNAIAWQRWRTLRKERCDLGKVICIDGGVGTEVERQTAAEDAVHPEGWSCMQWRTHAHVLYNVHRGYLEAGAEIIIANTYATNRHVMKAAGHEDLTQQANLEAVHLANQARLDFLANKPKVKITPLVAGSISCHPPGMAHGASMDKGQWPNPDTECAGYTEQAMLLRLGGVDLIFVEMVWDWSHGLLAVQGASSAGLPIAVCLSVFDESGSSAGMPRLSDGTSVQEVARQLSGGCAVGTNIEAIFVHHTKLHLVLPCLKAIRAGGWHGPVGCYPDHGTFKMPHWCFDSLEANTFLSHVADWKKNADCTIFGGCCGIGPETICCLSKWCDKENQCYESDDQCITCGKDNLQEDSTPRSNDWLAC